MEKASSRSDVSFFKEQILPLKNSLYRLALRITLNPQEAEDIVQDTMLKVWARKDAWQTIESIEAFCYTICRNLALDSLRKMGNDNDSLEETTIEKPDPSSNPLSQMQQKERMQMVKDAVNSLPEKQRSCMQLRDFEGRSYKEIAQVLNITEEQVKVNIFRARQAIKQKFSKQQ